MCCPAVAGCGAVVCSTLAPSCQPLPRPSASPQQTATPTATPTGFTVFTIHDSATDASCPPNEPSTAQCYTLTGVGTSPQYGSITVAPVLDVEFVVQPLCGTPHTFSETLRLPNGTLTAAVTAPYLCAGATTTTARTFAVMGGTGHFVGAKGSGTIRFQTLAVGALEIWQGVIS